MSHARDEAVGTISNPFERSRGRSGSHDLLKVQAMLKKFVLAGALAATSALAQESTDISGASFQSGKADETLASLGRKAAASGERLVITAPPEWHAKIAAKVRAGGKADVVLRDGFYETVLVRVEDKAAKAAVGAAPEPDRARVEAQRSRAEVEKAKAEAAAARVEAERARAEADAARAAADKANAEAAAAKAQAEAERAAAEKARLESERAAADKVRAGAASTGSASVPPVAKPAQGSASDAANEARARLEKAVNGGRAAKGTLAIEKLQSGDTLYVDGGQIAVARREGGKPTLFWLDGALDLRRSELQETAPNRYQVLGHIRGEGTLRREFAAGGNIDARVPAADSPARAAFEKNLNGGQGFSDTLRPNGLRTGDMLYVDGNAIAVARRDGTALARYWLVGSIDLQQVGIVREAAGRYRVVRDTIR